MMLGKWDGVEEMVAIEASGSFAAAAKLLGVSTSHVSRAIARLEDAVQARIYNRTTRSVHLTDVGRALLQHFQNIVQERDEALAGVSARGEPQGNLRITCSAALGERFVVPIVRQFAKTLPRLSVSIELTNRIVDLVGEGFDLAIRTGWLSGSRLIGTRIATRGLRTCAAPAYLENRARPVSIVDLNDHACLIGTSPSWHFSVGQEDVVFQPRGQWRCNNGVTILEAAIDGMGVCQLPDFYVADALRSGTLVPLLDTYRAQDEPIWAVYPERRHLLPKVRRLVETLRRDLPRALSGL
jgi:DNA-binding transcriptional LysR family regulator